MAELVLWLFGWPGTPVLVALALLGRERSGLLAWLGLFGLGLLFVPEPTRLAAASLGGVLGLSFATVSQAPRTSALLAAAAAVVGWALLDAGLVAGAPIARRLATLAHEPVAVWALAAGLTAGLVRQGSPWSLVGVGALLLTVGDAGQGRVGDAAVPLALLLGGGVALLVPSTWALAPAGLWLLGAAWLGPGAAGPYDHPPDLPRRAAARLEVVVRDGAMISSVAACPDGSVVWGELASGRIQRWQDGQRALVARVELPLVQGSRDSYELGLWGVACDPSDGSVWALAVHRWREDDPDPAARSSRLVRVDGGRVETVLSGLPAGPIHAGGALVFGPEGDLWFSVGDGLWFGADGGARPDRAPAGVGTIQRLPRGEGEATVWADGFRNVYGLSFDRSGALWATENGPDCCDALVQVQEGRFHGWPPGRSDVAPRAWDSGRQRLGPTGLVTLGDAYGPFAGDLLFATWHTGALHRVRAARGEVVEHEIVAAVGTGRPDAGAYGFAGAFTGLTVAPDGVVWFSTLNAVGRIPELRP